jgi:hypothetical protein
MAGKATTAAKPTNRKPDFTGVAGRLVELPADVSLQFGARGGRVSPYDALLEQLAAARDKVLEFGDLRARASVMARSKKLGIKVLLAEHGPKLYVKFGGWLPESDRWKAEVRAGIRDTVTTQPRNEIQVAVALRAKGLNDVDAGVVGAILKQMEQAGEVARGRDGSWGLLKAA